jgi:hypothetical protein
MGDKNPKKLKKLKKVVDKTTAEPTTESISGKKQKK